MLSSRQAEQHQQPSGGLTGLLLGRQAMQHHQQSSGQVAHHSLASLGGQAAGQALMPDACQAREGSAAPAALQRRMPPAQATVNDGLDSHCLLSHDLLPGHLPSRQHTAPSALAPWGSHAASPPLPWKDTAPPPALPWEDTAEPTAHSWGPDGAAQGSLSPRAAAAVALQTQESCLKVQAAAQGALDIWGEATEGALGDGAQAAQSALSGGAVNSGAAGSPLTGNTGRCAMEADVPAPQSRSSAGSSPRAEAAFVPQGYGCVPETPAAASGHDELPSKGQNECASRVPATSWHPSAAGSQGRAAHPMDAQEEGPASSRVAAGSQGQAAQAGPKAEQALGSWVPGGNLQPSAGGQHGQAEQAKAAQANSPHRKESLAGRQADPGAAQGEWPASAMPAGTWQPSAGRSRLQAAEGRAATKHDIPSQAASPHALSPGAEPGQVHANEQSATLAQAQCLAAEPVWIAGQQRLAGSPVQKLDGSRLLQLASKQLSFQDPVQAFSMSLDSRCGWHWNYHPVHRCVDPLLFLPRSVLPFEATRRVGYVGNQLWQQAAKSQYFMRHVSTVCRSQQTCEDLHHCQGDWGGLWALVSNWLLRTAASKKRQVAASRRSQPLHLQVRCSLHRVSWQIRLSADAAGPGPGQRGRAGCGRSRLACHRSFTLPQVKGAALLHGDDSQVSMDMMLQERTPADSLYC